MIGGILLIYFIGKHFYKLAEKFKQNKWLYAILAVVIYYAAGVVYVVTLVVLDDLFGFGIDWDNAKGLEYLAIPIGLAADYGFHVLLKKKWEKTVILIKDEIQDIGKPLGETEEN